jgi:hypothetical protein
VTFLQRAGVLGGIVTETDPAPCAAAVIFHGASDLGVLVVGVCEGLALYSYPSPLSQEVQYERTIEWARETLAAELSR